MRLNSGSVSASQPEGELSKKKDLGESKGTVILVSCNGDCHEGLSGGGESGTLSELVPDHGLLGVQSRRAWPRALLDFRPAGSIEQGGTNFPGDSYVEKDRY